MKPQQRRNLIGGFVIALLAACSNGGGAIGPGADPDGGPRDESGVVTIRLTSTLRFEPSTVEIDPGTTVRWVNDVALFHTVTPNNASQPGVWQRRESTSSGEIFRHTFADSGQTYSYHCEPHLAQGMVGTLRVR
jgi:plastocyanin